ncbi:MAG: hypothetical protein ACK504_01515, partial [Bacteroidota bacterium]
DAECGGIAAPYANMCSGTTFATLVAPPGFSQYQWIDPSGNAVVGGTNRFLILNHELNYFFFAFLDFYFLKHSNYYRFSTQLSNIKIKKITKI